jgi:hypothetical protein
VAIASALLAAVETTVLDVAQYILPRLP